MQTNRRNFLKTAVSTTAAFTSAPLFLNASDKAGSKTPRVGEGEYVYECEHFWGHAALPNGHAYGNASHGVAVDAQGLIYITNQGGPGSVFVFDGDGRFVKTLGELHKVNNRCQGHGIDIRKEGNVEYIYLSPSHTNLFFTKMTLDGEIVWNRGRAELHKDSDVLGDGTRYRPTNTSFRPDGGYYLGDGYGSNYLFEYDKHDKFVRVIGGPGNQTGQFSTPHGQWLDERDGTARLVVADRANKRLQWFDLDGSHVKTLDGFLFPADIDIRGDIMLVPDLHARITLLDRNNNFIAHLGDDADWREQVLDGKNKMRSSPKKWQPGKFVHPHDACFDHANNIYCVEWVVGGRVTKLNRV